MSEGWSGAVLVALTVVGVFRLGSWLAPRRFAAQEIVRTMATGGRSPAKRYAHRWWAFSCRHERGAVCQIVAKEKWRSAYKDLNKNVRREGDLNSRGAKHQQLSRLPPFRTRLSRPDIQRDSVRYQTAGSAYDVSRAKSPPIRSADAPQVIQPGCFYHLDV